MGPLDNISTEQLPLITIKHKTVVGISQNKTQNYKHGDTRRERIIRATVRAQLKPKNWKNI